MSPVDVVVVGAGLAGLSGARALTRAGLSVAVLEARDRVGGRTLSRAVGDVTYDLGAQYIGFGHERVRALAREFDLPTAPTPFKGRKWIDLAGRRASYAGAIPALPLAALLNLQLVLSRIERARLRVPGATPWSAPACGGARRADRRELVEPLHVRPARARALAPGHAHDVRRGSGRDVAAQPAPLRSVPWRTRLPDLVREGRAAGLFRGRLAGDVAANRRRVGLARGAERAGAAHRAGRGRRGRDERRGRGPRALCGDRDSRRCSPDGSSTRRRCRPRARA